MVIFHSKKTAWLFQNQEGDTVCCSTFTLPGGAGEEEPAGCALALEENIMQSSGLENSELFMLVLSVVQKNP